MLWKLTTFLCFSKAVFRLPNTVVESIPIQIGQVGWHIPRNMVGTLTADFLRCFVWLPMNRSWRILWIKQLLPFFLACSQTTISVPCIIKYFDAFFQNFWFAGLGKRLRRRRFFPFFSQRRWYWKVWSKSRNPATLGDFWRRNATEMMGKYDVLVLLAKNYFLSYCESLVFPSHSKSIKSWLINRKTCLDRAHVCWEKKQLDAV